MTIRVNSKVQLINVISNLGTELEVDKETLDRWNKVIGEWWEVQLEMDRLIQQKVRDDIQKSL